MAACHGTGADVREIIVQRDSYDASHLKNAGERLRPRQLEELYQLVGPRPKSHVVLVDDVLTTGAHFIAAKNVIRAAYSGTNVYGFFMARRVVPNPFADFDVL